MTLWDVADYVKNSLFVFCTKERNKMEDHRTIKNTRKVLIPGLAELQAKLNVGLGRGGGKVPLAFEDTMKNPRFSFQFPFLD